MLEQKLQREYAFQEMLKGAKSRIETKPLHLEVSVPLLRLSIIQIMCEITGYSKNRHL